MSKVYLYQGVEYKNERELRKAIFEQERKVFGKLKTSVEWANLGVTCVEKSHPELTEALEAQKEIRDLKNKLRAYDYIGVKIAMGCATVEEYSEQIAECEKMRRKINKLEEVLNVE